ncbi:hypothetical protein niasHT_003812 [Heterodera trifolii]|uniref:Uncharacterized protein n=1 Tax=Heterodera trifolii TaxID=157864 RepID=A0ABD2LV18_9BILA
MSCDVFVAIVRLSSYAVDQLEDEKFKQCHQQIPFSPSSFDLLMALPSTNGRSENNLKTQKVFALPKCKASQREAAEETALRFVRGICRSLCVRAVNVPLAHLDHPLPGCSSSSASSVHRSDSPRLIFIPITPSAVSSDRISDCFEFHSLATILRASANSVGSVDARSQNLVLRIGEWLSLGQCQFGPSAAPFPFLRSLFLTPSASLRILNCVHNPSFDPRQFRFCCQSSTEDKENGRKTEGRKGAATELDEEVKRSNALRAEMLRMEKYDKFVINPLFGANIFCQRQITAPRYFVRNHSSKANGQLGGEDTANGKGRGPQQRSPTEFWEQQYPLHKHAFDGTAERIRELLAQGDDPNEQDNDLWTPLHYCAFYNRLEACEALLLHPRTNVNVVNGTGATPLHFAALNGNIYVAELILSHQLADINIRDATGKTPLDLCVLVPKSDWRGVAFLLKQKQPAKLTKVEVQLISAPSLQVEVEDSQKVTAKELRTKVLQMEGVDSELGARIFAIWLMDSRLSLQLKAEQNVNVHLDKWTEHLDKFGSDSIGDGGGEERVKIVLKRDARTLLGDEQMLVRKVLIMRGNGKTKGQMIKQSDRTKDKAFKVIGQWIKQWIGQRIKHSK